MIFAVIAAIIVSSAVYLYWEYGMPESIYRREGSTPFWTNLENDTTSIAIKQGETKTVPVELHYWKGLRTLLGIKFEEPEAEHGGLYNAPDGLEISFNMDDGYVEVDNGKIIDIFSHRDVQLKQPSELGQRLEPDGQMVVAEIGAVTVSASDEVPPGSYAFGLGTSDAQINSKYGGNSQLLEIIVDDEDGTGNYTGTGEFPTKYNHAEIPDLHMIVQGDNRRYPGEEGSYCWEGMCSDTFEQIVPEHPIVLDRGSEIAFEFVNYRNPETFNAFINTIPPASYCTTDNATRNINCSTPEGVPELTQVGNELKYQVDAPAGTYIIGGGGNWEPQGMMRESDAVYFYLVDVK